MKRDIDHELSLCVSRNTRVGEWVDVTSNILDDHVSFGIGSPHPPIRLISRTLRVAREADRLQASWGYFFIKLRLRRVARKLRRLIDRYYKFIVDAINQDLHIVAILKHPLMCKNILWLHLESQYLNDTRLDMSGAMQAWADHCFRKHLLRAMTFSRGVENEETYGHFVTMCDGLVKVLFVPKK